MWLIISGRKEELLILKKYLFFDLADAARSSYGSLKRILHEAAAPLSSHVVDLFCF